MYSLSQKNFLRKISPYQTDLICPISGKQQQKFLQHFCFHHDSIREMKGRRASTFCLSPMLRMMGQGFQPLKYCRIFVYIYPYTSILCIILYFNRISRADWLLAAGHEFIFLLWDAKKVISPLGRWCLSHIPSRATMCISYPLAGNQVYPISPLGQSSISHIPS